MNNEMFEAFNEGRLSLVSGEDAFSQIIWSKHPTFEGVELKYIVTAKKHGWKIQLSSCKDCIILPSLCQLGVNDVRLVKCNSRQIRVFKLRFILL